MSRLEINTSRSIIMSHLEINTEADLLEVIEDAVAEYTTKMHMTPDETIVVLECLGAWISDQARALADSVDEEVTS